MQDLVLRERQLKTLDSKRFILKQAGFTLASSSFRRLLSDASGIKSYAGGLCAPRELAPVWRAHLPPVRVWRRGRRGYPLSAPFPYNRLLW